MIRSSQPEAGGSMFESLGYVRAISRIVALFAALAPLAGGYPAGAPPSRSDRLHDTPIPLAG